jgi:hypothetical protein
VQLLAQGRAYDAGSLGLGQDRYRPSPMGPSREAPSTEGDGQRHQRATAGGCSRPSQERARRGTPPRRASRSRPGDAHRMPLVRTTTQKWGNQLR